MNKEEILAMEAGMELDNLVRAVIIELPYHQWTGKPSTDISAAWEVVEKLFTDDWREQSLTRDHRTGIWQAEFGIGESAFAESFNLPEAICKAALLAKMKK